jgi:hypothetical protein
MLDGVDGRSPVGRRFRDLCKAFEAEASGPATESERSLIRQAATLTVRCEQMQADLLNGKEVNCDEIIRISGTVKRILDAITGKAGKRKPGAIANRVPLRERLRGGAG